jgi:hypothetical protein
MSEEGSAEAQGTLLKVELELELDREPVRGQVRSGGRSEGFVGWLGLAETLGRLGSGSNVGSSPTRTPPSSA